MLTLDLSRLINAAPRYVKVKREHLHETQASHSNKPVQYGSSLGFLDSYLKKL